MGDYKKKKKKVNMGNEVTLDYTSCFLLNESMVRIYIYIYVSSSLICVTVSNIIFYFFALGEGLQKKAKEIEKKNSSSISFVFLLRGKITTNHVGPKKRISKIRKKIKI